MENDEILNICVPGQRLCASSETIVSGAGTYEEQGYIYSTLAGIFETTTKDNIITIRVNAITDQSIVPAPGDIVTAMVTVVNQRFCKCNIKCIGDVVLTRRYKGILRKEDVRAVDRDRVEMYKSYRPGDIILARVLPMTEAHTYHLSTAENELGVVIAHSEEGVAMIPISWTQMQCPKTLCKEFRKVAKVVPEHVITER
ncbi:exosome complex component CSL4 [Polistes fuscatus]|uniref:exosome complex component CSL4 n=1 Tax=Polistes fuscatus TaxID=30207 RepID=UPI001CA9596F|nr:exosome complex component CSL4 [Polistes fuscatus]XP_043501734.1 exosome complex component CSL4 [Polistes fuscatus]